MMKIIVNKESKNVVAIGECTLTQDGVIGNKFRILDSTTYNCEELEVASLPPYFQIGYYTYNNGEWVLTDVGIEKIAEIKIKEAENLVQKYINHKCVELGYDNENSIAKYLVVGNPFYDECKAISLWIGSVWAAVQTIQADVMAGTILEPTNKEFIDMLPKYAQ